MIDTHCHILPGVDDGADGMQTAMLMAAMAADDGVRAVIATPHLLWDGRPVEQRLAKIEAAAEALRTQLSAAGIPLVIHTGAEVLCADTKRMPPTADTFPCLAGSHYALTEFYFDEPIEQMETHLDAIRAAGIRPIVAHPERYSAIQKDKGVLADWVKAGIHLQMNKGSAIGQFGRKAKKVADWALKNRLVTLIATDAHDPRSRTTRMTSTCSKLASLYGTDYVARMTEDNPRLILNGGELVVGK